MGRACPWRGEVTPTPGERQVWSAAFVAALERFGEREPSAALCWDAALEAQAAVRAMGQAFDFGEGQYADGEEMLEHDAEAHAMLRHVMGLPGVLE